MLLKLYSLEILTLCLPGVVKFHSPTKPRRLLRAQIGKSNPRCNSHYSVMGHVKIKNNDIPVSPDKWIYDYDINPITINLM